MVPAGHGRAAAGRVSPHCPRVTEVSRASLLCGRLDRRQQLQRRRRPASRCHAALLAHSRSGCATAPVPQGRPGGFDQPVDRRCAPRSRTPQSAGGGRGLQRRGRPPEWPGSVASALGTGGPAAVAAAAARGARSAPGRGHHGRPWAPAGGWHDDRLPGASARATAGVPGKRCIAPAARSGLQRGDEWSRSDGLERGGLPVGREHAVRGPEERVSRRACRLRRWRCPLIYASQRQLAARVAPTDEQMRKLLTALIERGGKLSRAALAQRLALPEIRLGGMLSAARRVLNVDQSTVLTIDETTGTIELNEHLLRQQFVIPVSGAAR
jgi:hypothetical protein